MTKTYRALAFFLALGAVLLGAWMAVSFFDINSHNMQGANYGDFLEWNFFIVLKNLIRG